MLLRLIGILILVGFVLGLVVLMMGLRRKPEMIRELSVASVFTVGGMLCVGYGLAFGTGLGRIVLVASGIAAYLYGVALSVLKHEARRDREN
jgi:Ca2+/Na+ antiporter